MRKVAAEASEARVCNPHPSAWGGPLAFALDLLRRRPADALAGLVATAGVATILINALLLQEGRRASPTFHESVGRPAAAVAERSEKVAEIQQALFARGLYDGAVDGLFGAKTASAIIAFEEWARLPATGEASDRVLAALKSSPRKDPSATQPSRISSPPPAARGAAQPPATTGSMGAAAPKLSAMQRGLAKLGYGPVTIDGRMGAATRAALLGFQRDRKLVLTGEPTPQTLRELQAASGVSLE